MKYSQAIEEGMTQPIGNIQSAPRIEIKENV
jgi:hypothetical protein